MTSVHPNTEQAYKLFHAGTLAFARAEQQGIRIDLEYCVKTGKHLQRKIDRLEERFRGTKFYKHWKHSLQKTPNINSNPQLGKFLYEVKKLKPTTTTVTGKGSTEEDALTQLRIPELNDLLKIRKLRKLKDTYLEGFQKEQVRSYIHPNFNLNLARTFRSSSSNPNFQNIPKRDKEAMKIIRKALYPRPGHQFLEVDFGQLEVRIAACYHKDPTMLTYIKDPTKDMHRDMAEQIFMMDSFDKTIESHQILRAATKNGFVFPEFYGDYYGNCAVNMACGWGKLPEGRWRKGQGIDFNGGTLADHLIKKEIKSIDHFREHIRKIEKDFWKRRFPVYAKWKDTWWELYQKNGYIDMLTGFRCSGLMGRNDAINYPVQGAAFHCLLWSFIELDRIIYEKGYKSRLIGQIHDAVVLDIHPEELNVIAPLIRRILTVDLPKAWPWIIVPLDIEMDLGKVDGSWAELHPYEF